MTETATGRPQQPSASGPGWRGETALITGASAGLGAEFARQLAQQGCDLVLVARNKERLDSLAGELTREYAVRAEVLPADLATDDGVAVVVGRLQSVENSVTVLVNNAGHGLARPFHENAIEDELGLLKILVTTPMELTHAALNAMLARRTGRIINVASVAGFLPGGTYSAAKAWLIKFSQSTNVQYGRRGVSSTAVCPGYVHTEFHQRMGVAKPRGMQWMWLHPERVVREGLRDALAGKSVSVPTKRYRVLAVLGSLAPEKLVAAGMSRARGR